MSLRRLVQTDSYTSGYLHQRYFQEFWQGQIVVIMDKSLTKFRFWLCFLQVSLSLSIFLVIQETGELENKAFIYNLYEIHAHKEHHAHTVEDLWGEGTPVWTRRNQSINNAVHYLLGTQYHILIFLLWEKQVFCVILWSNLITKWHISKDCWSTFNSFFTVLVYQPVSHVFSSVDVCVFTTKTTETHLAFKVALIARSEFSTTFLSKVQHRCAGREEGGAAAELSYHIRSLQERDNMSD